jgi:hypothetical protein
MKQDAAWHVHTPRRGQQVHRASTDCLLFAFAGALDSSASASFPFVSAAFVLQSVQNKSIANSSALHGAIYFIAK